MLFLGFLATARAMAQSENQLPIEFKSGYYVAPNNKGGNDTIPYQLVLPDNFQPGQTYPLMVLLHGSGERGNDNQAQLKHFLPLVNNGVVRKRYPFIYVIPQCPKGQSWSHLVFKRDSVVASLPKQATRPAELVYNLVRLVEKTYTTDPSRRYISGLSMGGFGTLELLNYYPGFFKAAVPICGGAHETHYKSIAKTPLWIFHGDRDMVVKVAWSRKLVEGLKANKQKAIYTELPGVAHDSWVAAYANPLWLDWLWAQ